MKTFADVKRRLEVGVKLKLVRHDWLKGKGGRLNIGDIRTIEKRQSNAIKFDTGSWLYFPKSSDVVTDGENQFSVVLSIEKAQFMTYEFV